MRRHPLSKTALLIMTAGIALIWVTLSWQAAAAKNLGPLDQPVSAQLLSQMRKISQKGLTEKPHYKNSPVMAINDQQAPSTNAPLVLYVGADFCPYCAVLRWPLALALMRFGHLSGLRYMRSSGNDVYPNTATFSFYGAHLNSDLLQFEAVEVEDRHQKTLQKPSSMQQQLFTRFDTAPYTQSPGSIPFLYMGGQYLELGSPFSPEPLQGLDWQQIAQKLDQGDNAVWRSIMGETNLLTAALCKLTDQKPASVCTASGIQAAAQSLPH